MGDAELEGMVSRQEATPTPEGQNMILDRLENRFMQLAETSKASHEPVSRGEFYRLAKGLEYMARTLKKNLTHYPSV